jgi:subtilisin family serine protease/subtilase family serine protease
MKRGAFVFSLLLIIVFLGGELTIAQNDIPSMPAKSVEYGYYYKDSLIILNPSKSLLAIEDTGTNGSFSALTSDQGLIRDPLSDRESLKNKGLTLYRMPAQAKGEITAQPNLTSTIQSFAQSTDRVIQPVFEQGPALLIPSDEVIVGFKETTSLSDARKYLTAHLDEEDVIELREHRTNTFILKIDSSSNGRVYVVSQSLAGLTKVSFAEPNHIVVMLGDQGSSRMELPQITGEMIVMSSGPSQASRDLYEPDAYLTEDMSATAPDWTTLAALDFESGAFPPAGWQASWFIGGSAASWSKTILRAHGGSSSIYCAGSGTAGVSPPGPAPTNMKAVLRSPDFNLSGYDEVYVEVWFYAKNELYVDVFDKRIFIDYPMLVVFDNNILEGSGEYLGTLAAGDCTTDPTTENGWRKLLYRVPPSFRVARAHFEFRYFSNNSVQLEGAYLDDIRIVGTTNIDTNFLGDDTYGARQYELKNVGQIAGLGHEGNDLHIPEAWDLASVSPDVVVAVIDLGVDLTHPDLNLVTGFDYNGTVGGYPRPLYSPHPHGTNCAGNVGAITNNGIGVIGTAPGVKIMPIYYGSTTAYMANAIDVAVNHGAHILSNSWGWVGVPSSDIENAVRFALAQGKIVLFAAGNGPDRPPYSYEVAFPANLTGSSDVICVGASSPTDEHKGAASSDGQFGWGSSYIGDGPDIVSPGPWSYATDIQGAGGYNDGSLIDPSDASTADYNPSFGGTSSSTPKVAGIVALMLSKNPNLSPAQVKSILRSTADDIDTPGFDDKTGAGRVNAYQAVLNVPSVTQKGSLLVNILPFEAVNAGAKWRVDEGPWQNSGTTYSGLSVGPHTVDFKDIIGWTKPANQVITITANHTTTSTGTYVQLTGDQPNLAPYEPNSWSDKIVVSNVTGTTTDATLLSPTDTIYIDWAVENNGTAVLSSAFSTTLYLDGVEKETWTTSSLEPEYYVYIEDYSLGSLAAGTHQITIVADSGNTVVETDENDNSYTKTITVGGSSSNVNLTPYKPSNWSDKIVVSTGTGTSTDSPTLSPTDNLYVDWAVINNGTSDISDTFEIKLYVDGVEKQAWQTSSLQTDYYGYITDCSVGTLGTGTHEITIVADPTNAISEINENDNSYTKTITVGGSSSNVNLTPYKPSNWSDKIVVSTGTGTNTDSSTLSPTDNLYVDWAVINNGTSDIASTIRFKLYVNGVEEGSWTTQALNANFYTYVADYSLGSLTCGSHQITIVADTDNNISETNENDNSYTKTIMVTGSNLLENGDFENGRIAWTETNSAGLYNIYLIAGLGHNNSDWYIYTGTEDNLTSTTYQDVVIPNNASQVYAQFWYKISTDEITSSVWDSMAVQILNPANGSVTDTLQTFSNLDSTSDWVESPLYDLSAYKGLSIRLNFLVKTDFSNPTCFRVDDAVVMVTTPMQQPLTVIKAGNGDGTVTPDSGVLTWNGNTGTTNYDNCTVVTLTAHADTGSTFAGWSGSGCSGTGTCTVTMDAAMDVTATFDLTTLHTLAVHSATPATGVPINAIPTDVAGTGDGETSFTLTYPDATEVTLTAPPTWDVLEFFGWDGCDNTTGRFCTVQMDRARSMTVSYDFPLDDNDGDGLPDAFETFYGIDTGGDDLTADFDGDGFCNLREYYGFTNPANPLDIPPLIADQDADLDVDGTDLGALINEIGKPCTAEEPCFFDFNDNGVVDVLDLRLFTEDFGRQE